MLVSFLAGATGIYFEFFFTKEVLCFVTPAKKLINTDQSSISQSLAHTQRKCQVKSFLHAILPSVKSESELLNVSLRMLLAHLKVGSINASFQVRPSIFYTISSGFAINILLFSMINYLMIKPLS
jgi:hypothetical protein